MHEEPVYDVDDAKERGKAEREKPEHKPKPDHTGHDPRDRGAEVDDPDVKE